MIEHLDLRTISDSQWSKDTKSTSPLPFYTPAWHTLWFSMFGVGWEPFFLLVCGSVVAPFVKNGIFLTFSGGKEMADYLDIIGPDEKKLEAWKELCSFLPHHGVTRVELPNVPQSSPTLSFFKTLSMKNPNVSIVKEDTTPTICLPGTWDEYLGILKRTSRHEIRRKLRQFESRNQRISLVASDDPRRDIHILLDFMSMDPEKRQFLTPTMRTFFQHLPERFRDTIILLRLLVGKETVAALLGFQVCRTFFIYNSGYNPAYSGAGFYLKATSIKRAIACGLKEYNFLQGNERYKYEFGGSDFFVYTIRASF